MSSKGSVIETVGVQQEAGTSTDTADLGSLSFDNQLSTSTAQSVATESTLAEGAVETNPDVIDAARQDQATGNGHHHHSFAKDFADEHRALQRAGFEGSMAQSQTGVLAPGTAASPGGAVSSSASAQLHEHIMGLFLTGSKKKQTVTDDAELAEFMRQHPELTQYINEIKQARDQALESAQENNSLDSKASLDAKLDVIATLLEGAPIAPQLRMGDQTAHDAFVEAAKTEFKNDEEGAVLAEFVWKRAQEKLAVQDQKLSAEAAIAEKKLEAALPGIELKALSANIDEVPSAEVCQSMRVLRNKLEAAGIDLTKSVDPATAEGRALEQYIDKNSPDAAHAARMKTLFLTAQLRAETYEDSAKLASEAMVDRFLALSPEQKKIADQYFSVTSGKRAEAYLLEAYMGMREYKRAAGSDILQREACPEATSIVAKIVTREAAAIGRPVQFKNGELFDDGAFRSVMQHVFKTELRTSKDIRDFAARMGGIETLDKYDYAMRTHAAADELEKISGKHVELTGEGLATYRAEALKEVLPFVVATNPHTQANLSPQFLATLAAIPADERLQLAAAFRKQTGYSLEQVCRMSSRGPITEATTQELSELLKVEGPQAMKAVSSDASIQSITELQAALQDPAKGDDLVAAAKELHAAIESEGISISRTLDSSSPEGKAFEAALRFQLKDEALVHQAKASVLAVELEQQGGTQSLAMASQELVGTYLALSKDEKNAVDRYFQAKNHVSAERYLIEGFSGATYFAQTYRNELNNRETRADAKQVIAALVVSSAERNGRPFELKAGQLADPICMQTEFAYLYPPKNGEPDNSFGYVNEKITAIVPATELEGLCRQAILVAAVQKLDTGNSGRPAADIDASNARVLATNLESLFTTDTNTGVALGTQTLAFVNQLPEERRQGLRAAYEKQTGRDILTDIRKGAAAGPKEQADYLVGTATLLFAQSEHEKRAGFIVQSVSSSGKLTPESFQAVLKGLDAEGCLAKDAKSIENLNQTVAAYERMTGESFAAMLERNGIKSTLVEAIRTGDRTTIDSFTLRSTLKGSNNAIAEVGQLLGGRFNLDDHPELAAVYEKTFGEKFGDVRVEAVKASVDAYRHDVEKRRMAVDSARKGIYQQQEELKKNDFNGADAAKSQIPIYGIYHVGKKFFYIWDGAYKAQEKDIARSAEDNLKATEVYAERAMRLKECDAWVKESNKLLEEARVVRAQGDQERAAALDAQATVLLSKTQCKVLDIPYLGETLDERYETALGAARHHSELVKAHAPAAQLEKAEEESRKAFHDLVHGAWSPNQTKQVREAIKAVMETDPSIDPRVDKKADRFTLKLITNDEGRGFLDDIPASALQLSKEERKQLDEQKLTSGIRELREREIIASKKYRFEIESEFRRNHMKPMGQRNLALLELEQRYTHSKNMAEFHADWTKALENFDRTESQLKTVRTGVLIGGSIVATVMTGGATAGVTYSLIGTTVASHGVQALGDVAAGNKTWGGAGKTFAVEGGKDVINVGLSLGMGALSGAAKGAQAASAASKTAQTVSALGKVRVIGTQLTSASGKGVAFGFATESANIGWESAMYASGAIKKEDFHSEEFGTRLLTASTTGAVGGLIGGSSQMLRGAIGGTGLGSTIARSSISIGEFSSAGVISQYGFGFNENGSLGIKNHGFDGLQFGIAFASSMAGHQSVGPRNPSSNGQLRSFSLYEPQPGVFSSPEVRSFSVHAAELQPVVESVGNFARGVRGTPNTANLAAEARTLSNHIAREQAILDVGYEEIPATKSANSSTDTALPLLAGGVALGASKTALASVVEKAPASTTSTTSGGSTHTSLPAEGGLGTSLAKVEPKTSSTSGSTAAPTESVSGNTSGGSTPAALPPESGAGGSLAKIGPENPQTGGGNAAPIDSSSGSNSGDATKLGTTTQSPGDSTSVPDTHQDLGIAAKSDSDASAAQPQEIAVSTDDTGAAGEPRVRKLSPEEIATRREALEALKAKFEEGLGKAKLDKGDKKVNKKGAAERAEIAESSDSKELREAQSRRSEIKEQLKRKGTDAVSGEARTLLEKELRVLDEQLIPTKEEVQSLNKKYKPQTEAEKAAIEKIAPIEVEAKRLGDVEFLSDAQLNSRREAYKVLEDAKFERTANRKLGEKQASTEQKAAKQGWAEERKTAETELLRLKTEIKKTERLTPEGTEKVARLKALNEQLENTKKTVNFEREVHTEAKTFGHGTKAEFEAARELVRARQKLPSLGGTADAATLKELDAALTKLTGARNTAQHEANISAQNARIKAKDEKVESRRDAAKAKIDKSDDYVDLRSTKKERADIDAALKLKNKDTTIVTEAHKIITKQIAEERARLPKGELTSPKLTELLDTQKALNIWNDPHGKPGRVSVVETIPAQRDVVEFSRGVLKDRLAVIERVELPRLKRINELVEGKDYGVNKDVRDAATKFADLEAQRVGRGNYREASEPTPGDRLPTKLVDPELDAAFSQLAKAKQLVDISRSTADKLAVIDRKAEKNGWQKELIEAKKKLLGYEGTVEQIKVVDTASADSRDLAVKNRDAARRDVEVESRVYELAIKNGSGDAREIAAARKLAKLDPTFDPLLGISTNPDYVAAQREFNAVRATIKQEKVDAKFNRGVDAKLERGAAKIDRTEELPELKTLRKELAKEEAAFKRRGDKALSEEGKALQTEKVDNLRSRIADLERVDQLARKNGYSTAQEIEAAKAIREGEKKLGTTTPSPDEIHFRLSPEEQQNYAAGWSKYQAAQKAEVRLEFTRGIDKKTSERIAVIDREPWIESRKAAARKEARLEGEIQKIKGNSSDDVARKKALQAELKTHREGDLRDAQRVDFLTRHKGKGSKAEVTAAEKLVAAEREGQKTAKTGGDVEKAKAVTADAKKALEVARQTEINRSKLLRQAAKVQWERNYSLEKIFSSVEASAAATPSTAAIIATSANTSQSSSSSSNGESATALHKRVDKFEELLQRQLSEAEIDFLGNVPEEQYRVVVDQISSGASRPTEPRMLTDGPASLEASPVQNHPALPPATETAPIIFETPQPVLVEEIPAARADARRAAAAEETAQSVKDKRENHQREANFLEADLMRGSDRNGKPIDVTETQRKLIEHKENVAALYEREAALEGKMLEVLDRARSGQADIGLTKQQAADGYDSLSNEIKYLKETSARTLAEIEKLRGGVRGTASASEAAADRASGRRHGPESREPSGTRDPGNQHRRPQRTTRQSGDDFSGGDSGGDWWRNGGEAPTYRPDNGPGGGSSYSYGASTGQTAVRAPSGIVIEQPATLRPELQNNAQRTAQAPVMEIRPNIFGGDINLGPNAFDPVLGSPRDVLLKPASDPFTAPVKRPAAAPVEEVKPVQEPTRKPMTTREVENFMLGVDDIDGSSIDAVFNHLDGNSGTRQQAPRAPFDFRAPSGPARSTQFERPTTTPEWSPEPQRQRVAPKPESEPLRTTVAVEEPLSDYDFASQIEALSRELDTTTALAPYDKTRTTALAKPVSEVTTADLTAPVAPPQFAEPVIQTRTVTEATVAEPQLSGQRALAPKIIVRGQTTTVIDPTQEPQLQPQPQRAPQPQPTKPATKVDEEQPHPRRHREEGGMSPAEEEKRHRKEENRDAKIIEKHALELKKPHRKGGGKLGHQKIHDLLGDDGDVLGDTEGHTTEG